MATYSGVKKIKIGDDIFVLDIPTATDIGIKFNYTTSGNNRAVQQDSSGNLYVTQKDDNTWTAMVGATSSANGSVGYVNATPPKDGYNTKFLRADGSWAIPNYTTNTDEKVKQTNTTTSAAYELLFSYTADNTERTEGTRKTSTLTYNPSTKALSTGGAINGLTLTAATTGFTIAGGSTTSKTLTVSESYTLGAACAKGVTDNSSNTDVTSSDTNLITGRTLYYQLTKKGYTTNTGTVTKVTAGTGLSIGSTAGGNFTTTGTINHTNSVTAQTTQAVYPIKIDAQGHISAYGTAVTIPTIPSNNVTGSGTSGYLAKWNGANSLTNGPQITSGGTGFLKQDGTWATPTNTDTKVTQSASTTSNWRKLLLHYKDDAASTTAVTTSTEQVYAAVGISAQPSTGIVRTNGYNMSDKAQMVYDSTLDAIVFTFL